MDIPPLFPLPEPDHGEHMTWDSFVRSVIQGTFIDYDGCGDYATETQTSNEVVLPSYLSRPDFVKPEWATHVVWYNR